jgi:ferritin-like metal-binding protein YciE
MSLALDGSKFKTPGGNKMALTTLNDLLQDEIRDLYSAEKQLTKALPKMAKASHNQDLKDGFQQHFEETQGQLERLQQIFELLELAPRAKHCEAMEGLVAEGNEFIEDKEADPAVRDSALIAAAQKVEHYEIAGYGSAKAHAELLGLQEIADLLEQTLEEEKSTDSKLNELAMTTVNSEAAETEGKGPHKRSRNKEESIRSH